MRIHDNPQNTYGITLWATPRIIEIAIGSRSIYLYLPGADHSGEPRKTASASG